MEKRRRRQIKILAGGRTCSSPLREQSWAWGTEQRARKANSQQCLLCADRGGLGKDLALTGNTRPAKDVSEVKTGESN